MWSMQPWWSELWHWGLIVQTISRREKIDGRWCVHRLSIYHYWKHFSCDCVHVTWWKQTNDNAGDERSISYTKNNDASYFSRIFDEEKGCGVVDTTHAISHTKTTLYRTVLETFNSFPKMKKLCFCNKNCYQWNLGVWLWTQIEILEQGLEGKKFTEATKIPTPSFEGEINDDNDLWYIINATNTAPYGCAVHQHVYVHFFHKILIPKGASTLCRAAEYNTLQLWCTAKVARHMPPIWMASTLKKNFSPRLQKLWNETNELRLIFFLN